MLGDEASKPPRRALGFRFRAGLAFPSGVNDVWRPEKKELSVASEGSRETGTPFRPAAFPLRIALVPPRADDC